MYDENVLRQKLKQTRPALYGQDCFKDYFRTYHRKLVWQSEGIGIFVSAQGKKATCCEMYLIDRDYTESDDHRNSEHCLALVKTKKPIEQLKKMQQTAQTLALFRAAGWKIQVKIVADTADRKTVYLVNPLESDKPFVLGVFSQYRHQPRYCLSLRQLNKKLQNYRIDPVKQCLESSGSKHQRDMSDIVIAARQALHSTANEHQVALLMSRHHDIPSSTLTPLIESVDVSELEHCSLAQAVEAKLNQASLGQ